MMYAPTASSAPAVRIDAVRISGANMAYFQKQFPNKQSLKVTPGEVNTEFQLRRDPRNHVGVYCVTTQSFLTIVF